MLADGLKAIPSAKIKPVMLADGLKAIPPPVGDYDEQN